MKTAFGSAGEVRGVDLLAAMVTLWRESASGSLRLARGGATSAGFDLADGEIVAVFSSESRFETAAILVRAGKVEPGALDRLTVPPGADAALAALGAGLLTRREWKWGEKIRAIEILADLLSWSDGKYLFDRQARPAPGEFALTIPRLLLELFLRSRDRNLIDHQLGPTDVPLVRSASFDEEFASFGLTADAESVVRLIDGGATAAEISQRAPAEEFAVLKLLAALKTLGLLIAQSDPETTPAAEASEPSPSQAEPDRAPFQIRDSSHESAGASAGPDPQNSLVEIPEPDLAQTPLARSEVTAPEVIAQENDWRLEDHELPPLEAPETDLSEPPLAPGRESPPPAADAWEAAAQPLDPSPARAGARTSNEGQSGRWGPMLVVLFTLLVAAVAGTVVWRSRSGPSSGISIAGRRATPAPTRLEATALPTVVVSTPIPTRVLSEPRPTPPAPSQRERERRERERPKSEPTSRSQPAGAAHSEAAPWLERARRDARRFQSEKATRYAIQLELVCEASSLAQAWKHDRPAGSLWLLTAQHGPRECFRVLWGRFSGLEQARRAKAGVPSYFVTSTNHPAVVSVR